MAGLLVLGHAPLCGIAVVSSTNRTTSPVASSSSLRYPSFRVAVAASAMSGGAGGGDGGWSPFDAIRSFPSTPESLMSQIDAAIASTEYARACALLDPAASASSRSQQPPRKGEGREEEGEASAARAPAACYDARVADEAYRAACAALGAGRADAAVRSLRVALSCCPPEKAAAVAKVRSMLAIASAQLHRQQHQAQQQQQSRK